MSKDTKQSTRSIFRAIGGVMIGVGLLLCVSGLLLPREGGGLELDWLFYLLMGIVYWRPAWLLKLYQQGNWGQFLIFLPTLIGGLLILLGDMQALPIQLKVDILSVLLYNMSIFTSFADQKKEREENA